MKTMRPLILITTFSLLLAAMVALAPTPVQASEGSGSNELHDKMEMMQDHYRTLGRGLRGATADDLPELLNAVQQLQLLTLETKVLVPSKAMKMDEADRPAFIQAYREKQIDTLETLLKMEKALLATDFEAVGAEWDALKDHKSEGHEAFQK